MLKAVKHETKRAWERRPAATASAVGPGRNRGFFEEGGVAGIGTGGLAQLYDMRQLFKGRRASVWGGL